MSTDDDIADDPMSVLYSGAIGGKLDTVRSVLQKNRELFDDHDCMNMIFHHVAGADQPDMLALLSQEFGVDVNVPKDERTPEGALDFASSKGAVGSVRWLLDHGAKVNHQVDGKTRCFALGSAVRGGHLAIVKLLLEHGADLNAVWAGKNALSFALMYGKEEIANFLRAQGALEPDQLAAKTESIPPTDPIVQHVERHLGRVRALALREIVAGAPPITLHAVTMEDKVALFTCGMASRPMTVPPEGEAFRFAELLMFLPKDWPLTDAGLKNPKSSWPIRWMLNIARYPHENQTWLGGQSAVFTNDEPPRPLAPNTQMTCLLATTKDTEFDWFPVPDGRRVVFYTLQALYTEERDLEKSIGVQHLLELFEAQGVSPVLDVNRPNVAPFSWGYSAIR